MMYKKSYNVAKMYIVIITHEKRNGCSVTEGKRRKIKLCQMNRYNALSISDKLVFIDPHCSRRRVMRMVIVKVIKKSRAINAH